MSVINFSWLKIIKKYHKNEKRPKNKNFEIKFIYTYNSKCLLITLYFHKLKTVKNYIFLQI